MYFIPLLQSETCTLVRFRFVLYSIDVIIVLDCTLLLAPVDYNGPGCDESVDGEVVRAVLWPGCVVARPIPGMPKATTLQWLLDIDYKGWAPRCLLDWTVPFAQVIQNFLLNKTESPSKT